MIQSSRSREIFWKISSYIKWC